MVRVCVTGGAGYIASSLVSRLLSQGFSVHATLRDLNDESKVQLLRSLAPPSAPKQRLKLFQADIYRAEEFEAAIQGCDFVFHVATPLLHTPSHKHTNRVDATVDAARTIATACIRSTTVKRLIYTASVMAASPLHHHGIGFSFKDVMDETCWTPPDIIHSLPHANDFLLEYTKAKTSAEKELLSFGNNNGQLEVVTLACGLVGGITLLPQISGSLTVFLAPLTNDEFALNSLKFLQQLLGKVPVVHIEDVVKAHMLCLKEASMNGRFLCANGYVSTADIATYYKDNYPEFSVKKEHLELEEGENGTKWGSKNLLEKRGFAYQHGWQKVLDDCITCARERHLLGDIVNL